MTAARRLPSRIWIAACILMPLCMSAAMGQSEGDPFDEEAAAQALEVEAQALRKEASDNLNEAARLFSELGTLGSASAEAVPVRIRLVENLNLSRAALRTLAENHVAHEEWAEETLTKLESLAFWVKRVSPVALDLDEAESDEDDSWLEEPIGGIPSTEENAPADSRETNPPALDKETESLRLAIDALPEGTRPQIHETAGQAMEAARAALEAGDLADAFYGFVEVITFHASDPDSVAEASSSLLGMRADMEDMILLNYLADELGSEVALTRAFAAREIGTLGLAPAIPPMIRQLQKERSAVVRELLFEAFTRTPRRLSCEALAKLSRGKKLDLKLVAIDTLAQGLGGRRAAGALSEFTDDDDPDVWRAAIAGMSKIGGNAAALAFGKIASRRSSSAKMVLECLQALSKIETPVAAAQLSVHLERKSKYLYTASDGIVRMGHVAVPALVHALGKTKLRQEANDCLRRISGRNMNAAADRWKDWYREWVAGGQPALPRYARGAEPWNSRQ